MHDRHTAPAKLTEQFCRTLSNNMEALRLPVTLEFLMAWSERLVHVAHFFQLSQETLAVLKG